MCTDLPAVLSQFADLFAVATRPTAPRHARAATQFHYALSVTSLKGQTDRLLIQGDAAMGPDLEDSTHESLESILDQKIKFWEDDLNISDLLSSANEENWMPREIPSEYDKLALAGLRELGIYDENTKHWALGKLKGDEASTTYATELELAWSRVFNQVCSQFSICAAKTNNECLDCTCYHQPGGFTHMGTTRK